MRGQKSKDELVRVQLLITKKQDEELDEGEYVTGYSRSEQVRTALTKWFKVKK